MTQLGGHAIYISGEDIGIASREAVQDIARTLSRMVDAIMARTFSHELVEQLACHAEIPVINALTDYCHPCQAMADLLTVLERRGTLRGVRLAYVGDGFNVAQSLAEAAALTGVQFGMASPHGYELPPGIVRAIEDLARSNGASFELHESAADAVRDADVVYTDVWASMGQEDTYAQRKEAFAGYSITADLMSLAKPDAIFMHDLPAHRGEEVTEDVIEGPQSVVFDQAENRLHAQKAILALVASEHAL